MDFVWKGHIIDSLDRHSLRVRENSYLVCQEGRCAAPNLRSRPDGRIDLGKNF